MSSFHEAVLSGFGAPEGASPRITEEELSNFLKEVQLALLAWFQGGDHNITELITTLDSLESSDDLDIYFRPRSSNNTLRLWAGADYRGDGSINVYVNTSMNPKRTQYPGSSTQRMYTVFDHMHELRETLVHELVHAEQSRQKRSSPTYSRFKVVYHTPPPGLSYDNTLREFRHAVRYPKEHTIPQGSLAHSLYTGDTRSSSTSSGNWYFGQPEEIMAYAVEVGDILTRPQGGSLEAYVENFWNVALRVKSRLSFGGKHTSAYKRFLKYLAEYLTRYKHMKPQDVSKMINRYFN